VEFKAGDRETAGYVAALEDDMDREYHECMRLLYVAMTRAENRLSCRGDGSAESSG